MRDYSSNQPQDQTAHRLVSVTLFRQALAERVTSGDWELPLFPEVATQVITLSSDSRSGAARMARLIHGDQSLAGNVLRISNSALYAGTSPIVSLQQAIARIGMGRLVEIALSVSLQSGMFSVPGYGAELRRLWRHSLSSAYFAKEIARLKRSNVEIAFLCGLLHGVGKPVLLQIICTLQTALDLTLGPEEVFPLVHEYHRFVGVQVAEKWNLPDQVKVSVEHYRDYREAERFADVTMIVHLANHLATHLLDPEDDDPEWFLEEPVLADLNLYPDEVDHLVQFGEKVTQFVESLSS